MKTFTDKNLLKGDISILIPIYVDHEDRIDNLKKILNYFYFMGIKDVWVNEYYSDKPLCDWVNCNYRSKKIDDDYNKMTCTNEIFDESQGQYLAIWDVDVIFPRSAIDKSLELLENGADVVYPYNGNFYNVPKKHFDMLESGRIEMDKCELWNENSYGGCVMFKRGVFEAGGKGNTKFIGWGFEDDEIFVRFSKLGYKIIRLDNPLFHMEHTRTSNLDGKSKYYLNNKEIYDNIRAMSREEILEEINNWK